MASLLNVLRPAARKAQQIQSLPDPVPYELLAREPEGEDATIERPDGTRIFARSAGDGPTVVLAHGYGATILEWNLIWDALRSSGCRVIAFDQRGHGRSTIGADGIGSAPMAGDYQAVLQHYDVQDAVLAGHSMGGFLGVRAVLDQPDVAPRLRGFVLFASTAGDILVGSPQNRLQIPLIRLGIMTAIARSPVYSWLFGASLCGDSPSPAAIRAFLEVFAVQRHDALVPIIEALAKESYYDRLGEITVPTVVICGDKDQTTPRWHSEKLGKSIPNARNVWVPGKGHLLNWESPESLVEVVESLLG
ncbi:MAG TPA: alpha/beta hydrolase [Enhygromyxa sp.]|nr:alpha/beta hydrolase [Enhygromyxa sp.]